MEVNNHDLGSNQIAWCKKNLRCFADDHGKTGLDMMIESGKQYAHLKPKDKEDEVAH